MGWGMGLRMKNFNIGFHWKIRFLRGGGIHEKPIYRDEFSKKGGASTVCRFK